MEGDDQRRRQYEQQSYPRGFNPNYPAHSTSVPNPRQSRGAPQGDGSDRFRHAQLIATRPPTSAPMIASAGTLQDMGGYGYGSGQQYTNPQIQGAQFPYQPDYLQESQRQRNPSYQSQPPQMMYGAQQQPQAQPSYGQMGGYQPGQPGQTAAVEVLSSQFGVPQYYNTAETTTTSAPPAISQGYQATVHAQVQYSPANTLGHSTLASNYPTLAPNFSPTAEPDEPPQLKQDVDLHGDQLANYERAIRETNDNTSKGRLVEAGSSLKVLTDWLLCRVGDLGLTRDTKDNQPLYRQRLELWDNFNNCWLAFLQRQKDDTRQMRRSGEPPVASQSLMAVEGLDEMVNELIIHCDSLERSGLVDYQMGVAEEEIVALFHECLDLSEHPESSDDEGEEEDDNAQELGSASAPPAPVNRPQ